MPFVKLTFQRAMCLLIQRLWCVTAWLEDLNCEYEDAVMHLACGKASGQICGKVAQRQA